MVPKGAWSFDGQRNSLTQYSFSWVGNPDLSETDTDGRRTDVWASCWHEEKCSRQDLNGLFCSKSSHISSKSDEEVILLRGIAALLLLIMHMLETI